MDVVLGVVVPIAVGLVLAAAAVTTPMKGRLGMFLLGFVCAPVWFVAAARLARPDSHWASWFYGPEKTKRAEERFGEELRNDRTELDSWPADDDAW